MNDSSTPPPPPPESPYRPPSHGEGRLGGGQPAGTGNLLPWEERDRLGFVTALVETVKLIVTNPTDAFSRLRVDGDMASPILFGVILTVISVVFNQLWSMLFGSLITALSGDAEAMAFMTGFGALQLVAAVAFTAIFYVVFLFIGAGINHLCLMLVGALDNSQLGFDGTLKVVAYSSVSGLANIIPFVGGIIQLVFALVLLIVGLAAVHKTTQGKAAIAVLIPVAVCCACIAVLFAAFGAAIMTMLGAAMGNLNLNSL